MGKVEDLVGVIVLAIIFGVGFYYALKWLLTNRAGGSK